MTSQPTTPRTATGALLRDLFMATMEFFASHSDMPMPLDVTGALQIMHHMVISHDEPSQQRVLALCFDILVKCAACEDSAVDALLKQAALLLTDIDASKTTELTLHDAQVLMHFSRQLKHGGWT